MDYINNLCDQRDYNRYTYFHQNHYIYNELKYLHQSYLSWAKQGSIDYKKGELSQEWHNHYWSIVRRLEKEMAKMEYML